MSPTMKKIISEFLLKNALYIVMFVLLSVIVMVQPSFLQIQNFYFIVTQSSSRIILALGIASIFVLGYTDLSWAAMLEWRQSSLHLYYKQRTIRSESSGSSSIPHFFSILLVMILCSLFMVVQAFVVSKLKVAPFIASLGFN